MTDLSLDELRKQTWFRILLHALPETQQHVCGSHNKKPLGHAAAGMGPVACRRAFRYLPSFPAAEPPTCSPLAAAAPVPRSQHDRHNDGNENRHVAHERVVEEPAARGKCSDQRYERAVRRGCAWEGVGSGATARRHCV